MDEQIIEILNRQPWEKLILRLSAYAVNYCRIHMLPIGWEPEDMVMDAIQLVYDGTRQWNPESDPDLYKHLISIINSLISNIRTSSDAKSRSKENSEDVVAEVKEYINEEIYCQEIDQKILELTNGDPEAKIVYKGMKDGYKPREIAEEYGLDISQVHSARKRIHRLFFKALPSTKKNRLKNEK